MIFVDLAKTFDKAERGHLKQREEYIQTGGIYFHKSHEELLVKSVDINQKIRSIDVR